MEESDIIRAEEDAKKAADPSYEKLVNWDDNKIVGRFADEPICKMCVHRYRCLHINEASSSSSSEDEEEGGTAGAKSTQKPASKLAVEAVDSKDLTPKKKKANKSGKSVELDLTKHPVSEAVPWDHMCKYPVSKLVAPNFCTASKSGQQNWPLTLACMTVGIDSIVDGKFLTSIVILY